MKQYNLTDAILSRKPFKIRWENRWIHFVDGCFEYLDDEGHVYTNINPDYFDPTYRIWEIKEEE